MMDEAVDLTANADIFVVIGSSLNVYPAAGLISYAPAGASLWLIDPKDVSIPVNRKVEVIREVASKGVEILTERLMGEMKGSFYTPAPPSGLAVFLAVITPLPP